MRLVLALKRGFGVGEGGQLRLRAGQVRAQLASGALEVAGARGLLSQLVSACASCLRVAPPARRLQQPALRVCARAGLAGLTVDLLRRSALGGDRLLGVDAARPPWCSRSGRLPAKLPRVVYLVLAYASLKTTHAVDERLSPSINRSPISRTGAPLWRLARWSSFAASSAIWTSAV